jgi:glycosyltransferase involved in cell wall biosynthesis
VAQLINAATLVLMPCRVEGFGLVALEAALMGRAVVATQVGGLAEVVVHEETGLLVKSGDSAAFAKAIMTLLTHQDTARTYGRAARIRAQNIFGWARYVDAYDAFYRTLGKGATPAEKRN